MAIDPQNPYENSSKLVNGLTLQGVGFVKRAFVKVLRIAFAHPSTPPAYRYDTDPAKRQIDIIRISPNKTTMLPAIIVEASSNDASIKQLGQEIVAQIFDDDEKTLLTNIYGGVIFIPVRITILTKTLPDREYLSDLVHAYIRYIFRPLFAKNNLEYLDIQVGDETAEGEDTSNPIYGCTITVQCQGEFEQHVDMSLYTAIQKIDLSQIKFRLKTETES